MKTQTTYSCVICGEETPGNEDWFLITSNRWQDKLRILHWNDHLASQASVQHLCCAGHVQEMVVHWMTTGSMEYPFARVPFKTTKSVPLRQRLANPLHAGPEHEIDTRDAQPIGELSVHRESMQRILRESPHSLTSILDALLSALQRDEPQHQEELESEDEELCGIGRQV